MYVYVCIYIGKEREREREREAELNLFPANPEASPRQLLFLRPLSHPGEVRLPGRVRSAPVMCQGFVSVQNGSRDP